jgi:hypothetical protein
VHIVAQYILQGRGWDSEGSDTSLPVSAEEQTARRVLYWYSKNRVRVQGLQVVHGRDAQANTEREVFFEQLEGFIKHKWHADDRQPHAYIRNSLKQDAEAQIAA